MPISKTSGSAIHRKRTAGRVWLYIGFSILLLTLASGCSRDQSPDIAVDDPDVRARIIKTYERAQNGEAEAQNTIGRAYARGDGLAKSRSKARKWFERAARQGHPVSQYNLYLLLTGGSNTSPTDRAEALKWLKAAADRDWMVAQFRLAEIYRDGGPDIPQDMQKAAELYEAAAIQGYPPAQYNIGRFYEEGRGVQASATTAFGWFLKAARSGVTDAQIKVGMAYQRGRGVDQDQSESFRWFERAALRNSRIAQYNLSALYALGEGVDKNLVRAYAWSEMAARQGLPKAIANRDAYSRLLTAEQRARAEALVERWSEHIAPASAHDHRENSYFEKGMADPISGLESLDTTPVTHSDE